MISATSAFDTTHIQALQQFSVPDWVKRVHLAGWGQSMTTTTNNIRHLTDGFDIQASIYVRDEYLIQWDSVVKARSQRANPGEGGQVIMGQPGIGKSYCLRYNLSQALEAKIPVIFVPFPQSGRCYFFCDQEHVFALDIESLTDLTLPHGTIILCDSSYKLEPPPIHLISQGGQTTSFLVHAASPPRARYAEWAKQKNAVTFVMKLWSQSEIEDLIILRHGTLNWTDKTTYSPLEIFEICGPSPRACFPPLPIKISEGWAKDLLGDVNPMRVLSTAISLQRAHAEGSGQPDTAAVGFHKVFLVEPIDGHERPSFTPPTMLVVPTASLRQLILSAYKTSLVTERALMAGNLAFGSPEGFAYEISAIDFLLHTTSVQVVHLRNPNATIRLPPCPQFQLSTTPLPTQQGSSTLSFGMYVPSESNFASLDAVYFFSDEGQDRIVMLQVTRDRDHSTSDRGILIAIDHFAASAPKAKWSFVFVTDSEEKGLHLINHRNGILGPRSNNAHSEQERESTADLRKGDEIDLGYVVVTLENKEWKAMIEHRHCR